MNVRRGVSFTELLVVMGTSTVALMGGIGMLRQAMTQYRYAENECGVHRVAERLTTQFRQDVHAAESVAWPETNESSQLRLRLPEGPQGDDATDVIYEVSGEEIVRTARARTAADNDDLNPLPHRESFRFANDCRIELRRLESPDRLQLKVGQYRLPLAVRADRDGSSSSANRADVRTIVNIQAVVGKHYRDLDAGLGDQGVAP